MNPQDNREQPTDTSVDGYPNELYAPVDDAITLVDEDGDTSTETVATSLSDEPPIIWTAQEYVHATRGVWWYVVFTLVVIGLVAVDIVLLRSWTFSVLVVVMAAALFVYFRRPPRDIQYSLSGRQGLYIGERLYHLSDFRAFGVVEDEGRHSIMLIPTKRFAPAVSVYFPEEVGERIVDILGQRLPMEAMKLDAIDVMVRKLRL